MLTAALLYLGGRPPASAVMWGALSGVGCGAGALFLAEGFRRGEFSVAGPVSAVIGAGGAALAGLALGERLAGGAWTGIILALPAIALVSASVGPRPHRGLAGAGMGIMAGIGCAVSYIGLAQAKARRDLAAAGRPDRLPHRHRIGGGGHRETTVAAGEDCLVAQRCQWRDRRHGSGGLPGGRAGRDPGGRGSHHRDVPGRHHRSRRGHRKRTDRAHPRRQAWRWPGRLSGSSRPAPHPASKRPARSCRVKRRTPGLLLCRAAAGPLAATRRGLG